MKSVVMIAHGFPPEGNAGAYRPLRFVRHLPLFGWYPSVVTALPHSYERYDPALLELIPPGTEIERVRSVDLWQSLQAARARRIRVTSSRAPHQPPHSDSRLDRVRSFVRELIRSAEARYYHPDPCMHWIRPAATAAARLVTRVRANVIWATAGPISAFLAAEVASRETGVPYVLDFRDPWTVTVTDFEARRPRWAVAWDRRTLYRLLREARSVVFRYPAEAECFWRAYSGALDVSRIHIIPNGYEGAIDDSPSPVADRCTIVYTGTLSSYRFDTLIDAVAHLNTATPDVARLLKLVFVGEGVEAISERATAYGLSAIIETRGKTSRTQALKLQRDAHALLILGRPATIRGYELLAGAKLYDYLKAGRPIVGVLPADETRRTLLRISPATVADVDSRDQIVAVMTNVIHAWANGTLSTLLPDRAACEEHSAHRQTAALVSALEGTSAAEPYVPGTTDIPASLEADIAHGKWIPSLATRQIAL